MQIKQIPLRDITFHLKGDISYISTWCQIFEIIYNFDTIISNVDKISKHMQNFCKEREDIVKNIYWGYFNWKKIISIICTNLWRTWSIRCIYYLPALYTIFSLWLIDIYFARWSWYKGWLRSPLKLASSVYHFLTTPHSSVKGEGWNNQRPEGILGK